MSTEPGSTVWGQDIYQAQGWLYKNQITPPTDPTSPAPPPGAAVRVKYVGRFLDGKVFDQSDDFTFQLGWNKAVSYTHLRAHETPEHLVCRLLLEKKKKNTK
eukprot:TRINITY_DN14734_c0_g2_i1.p1 TRINITY_DN14734_c0_g2~~TRINITY_DN14734_c0_g2_i1.p1  ORF type:complete len:102 (+),score=23.25 TRINITY_DN14734_c0_g2_i1:185-490(+)